MLRYPVENKWFSTYAQQVCAALTTHTCYAVSYLIGKCVCEDTLFRFIQSFMSPDGN